MQDHTVYELESIMKYKLWPERASSRRSSLKVLYFCKKLISFILNLKICLISLKVYSAVRVSHMVPCYLGMLIISIQKILLHVADIIAVFAHQKSLETPLKVSL